MVFVRAASKDVERPSDVKVRPSVTAPWSRKYLKDLKNHNCYLYSALVYNQGSTMWRLPTLHCIIDRDLGAQGVQYTLSSLGKAPNWLKMLSRNFSRLIISAHV